MEYCLALVRTHTIDSPREMNIEQIAEISQRKWAMVSSPVGHLLIATTANVCLGLPGSISLGSSVPSMGSS